MGKPLTDSRVGSMANAPAPRLSASQGGAGANPPQPSLRHRLEPANPCLPGKRIELRQGWQSVTSISDFKRRFFIRGLWACALPWSSNDNRNKATGARFRFCWRLSWNVSSLLQVSHRIRFWHRGTDKCRLLPMLCKEFSVCPSDEYLESSEFGNIYTAEDPILWMLKCVTAIFPLRLPQEKTN